MAHLDGSKLGVDAVRDTARTSLAVSGDATALPAVVATPSLELPPPVFHFNGNSEEVNGANGNTKVSFDDSAISPDASTSFPLSRSNSFTSSAQSPARRRNTAQQKALANVSSGILHDPVCFPAFQGRSQDAIASTSQMVLELADGNAFQGFSFGAKGKSISGECVFQTGELELPIPPNLPPSLSPLVA